MSTKHPYQSLDEQLREQFEQFSPELPEGIWEGMEADLDSMNADLQFDQGIRQGIEQLQVTPPQGVFEAIQAQLPAGAGWGGISLVGKWVAGVLLTGTVATVAWVGLSNSNTSPVPKENTEAVQPAAKDRSNGTVSIEENNTADEATASILPSSGGENRNSGQPDRVPAENRTPSGPATPLVPNQDQRGDDGRTPMRQNPPLKANPVIEEFAPVVCFSAKDTNLCMLQPYAFYLKNSDNCKYDIWIDNAPYARNIPGDKGVAIAMDRSGMRTLEINIRRGEKVWKKTQTLYVSELPTVNVMLVDLGNGKYGFESGCTGNGVSWFMDGTYHSKGNSTQIQFYDQLPNDHQVLAVANTSKGCSDSAALEFRNNVVFQVKPLVMPNSFSPNGDGVNDNYLVEIEGATYFQLRMYNQNNELVFETADPKAGWDGKDKFRGNTVHTGKYTCIVEYALAGGQKMTRKREVILFID